MRHLSDIIWHQHPLTMPAGTSVAQACRQMAAQRVGAVLVTDSKGRLLGIYTGRDGTNRVLAEGKNPGTTALADVMTKNPTTMPPGTTAVEALRVMWDGGFRHIPIVDQGTLVGVVSRGDFGAAEQGRLEDERELWEHMR